MAIPFIKYQTRRLLKKNASKRDNVAFEEASKVGILFKAGSKEKFSKIKELYLSLKGEGKEVDVLSYLGKNQENFEFLFKIYTDKDFSFWGTTEHEDILQFINKDFDYVLHIDIESHPMQDYILAASKARCRVGRYDPDRNEFYEMMFRTRHDEGIELLVDQISYYTHKITNV